MALGQQDGFLPPGVSPLPIYFGAPTVGHCAPFHVRWDNQDTASGRREGLSPMSGAPGAGTYAPTAPSTARDLQQSRLLIVSRARNPSVAIPRPRGEVELADLPQMLGLKRLLSATHGSLRHYDYNRTRPKERAQGRPRPLLFPISYYRTGRVPQGSHHSAHKPWGALQLLHRVTPSPLPGCRSFGLR